MSTPMDVDASPGTIDARRERQALQAQRQEEERKRLAAERSKSDKELSARKAKKVAEFEQAVEAAKGEVEAAATRRAAAKAELRRVNAARSKLEAELKRALEREGKSPADAAAAAAAPATALAPLALPAAAGRLPLAPELMAPALLVWDAAQTFHKQLKLACFSFDDFAFAVASESVDSVLLIETVRSMLRLILAEGAIAIEDEDKMERSDDDDEEEEESEEESEEGDEEEEEEESEEDDDDESEEDEGTPLPKHRVSRKPRRLGVSPTPRSTRKRQSMEYADKVTPRNWESMLRRCLRGLSAAAAGRKEGWVKACGLALEARKRMAGEDGAPFRALPLANKVGALCALALGLYGTHCVSCECAARKEAQEDWVRDAKEREKDLKADKKEEQDAFKEEAIEMLRAEKTRKFEETQAKEAAEAEPPAKKAKGDGDDDDGAAKAPAKKAKEPSFNEIARRVEQLRAAEVVDHRVVLEAPPADEALSDDEAEADPDEADLSLIERNKRRKALGAARERNAAKRDERARRARRDEDRAEVNEMIRAALADDDDAGLKAALKAAKGAELLGADGAGDDGDEPWCTKLVADAMRRSHAAKQKRDDDKERLKHAAGLASHDVRREPLGVDRDGRRYWQIDAGEKTAGGDRDDRLFRVLVQELAAPAAAAAGAGAPPRDLAETSLWSCYSSWKELKLLYRALSDAVPCERSLRAALAAQYNAAEPLDAKFDEDWHVEGHAALRSLVQRKFGRKLAEGVVTGWLSAEHNEGLALWHVEHGDGDEEDLEEDELEAALADHASAFRKYTNTSRARNDAKRVKEEQHAGVIGVVVRKELNVMGYDDALVDELFY